MNRCHFCKNMDTSRENLIYKLIILLICRVVLSNSRTQKFHAGNEVLIISNNSSTAWTEQVSSLLECTMVCSLRGTCCTANYDSDAQICLLEKCCFLDTKPTVDALTIRLFPGEISVNPKDCSDLPLASESGVYTIYPENSNSVNVYCDMETDCGGWTVVQRRMNGLVDFYLDWNNYKNGFGDVNGEYWLGNKFLHSITAQRQYKIRFDLQDFNNDKVYATYSLFYVDDEASGFTLSVSNYTGTAGDSMFSQNDRNFTTKDVDNDVSQTRNCATKRLGGWWYQDCGYANINGQYNTGPTSNWKAMFWFKWHYSPISLKATQMKIKPV